MNIYPAFYPIAYEKKKSWFPVLSDNLIFLCLNIFKQQIHITYLNNYAPSSHLQFL